MPRTVATRTSKRLPAGAGRLKINVQKATTANVPPKSKIAQWARAAIADHVSHCPALELTVRIVDEPDSAELNRDWRGKTGPTNVLSFSFGEIPGVNSCFLGDLVICAPVVMREAQEQGKHPDAHWAHMLVHGIMHLRGYDHENDQDARAMEEQEIQVMEQLGWGNPYI